MKEIFKDIEGYEGLYQISNLGSVKSLERKWKPEQSILKPYTNVYGYNVVTLRNNNRQEISKIHRLVAQAFIPNPDNLPQVNHKNEIKTDNRVENLEWCDAKYNTNYGTYKERMSKKLTNRTDLSIPILCVETGITFQSIQDAERWLNKSGAHSNIVMVLKGQLKTAYGYHWKYIEKEVV